ncbi:MAG: hypothetical protein HXY50_05735 [Ignavibacteriaceae bacterium]|nr:hypothetical protein [Ignavibacteriaceae bacterium]
MFRIFKKPDRKLGSLDQKKNELHKVIDTDQEIAAVIGYALFLHLQELHDYDNMVLTIQKVVRPYSPWSSKIYGLRQMPRR